MSENHIVKVPYSERGFCRTRPVFQYDYGQVLQLEGFPEGMLPAAYEVHFDIGNNQSTTMIGQEDGVDIPDSCLTGYGSVNAWLFLHDAENDGETRFTINIPIKERAEPTDIEPMPVQQDVITQTVAALNSAVNDVKYANAHVVRVSDTQPDDENVRIWVKPESEEYRIPSWEEHLELASNTQHLTEAVADLSSIDRNEFLKKTDIDDSAHDGDLDKLWSADKISQSVSAKADRFDTVLDTTLSRGRNEQSTIGAGSIAFGYSSVASGDYSRAVGESTTASGYGANAEGYRTEARLTADHAEGVMTVARGGSSHSEGFGTIASGNSSHSEGDYTTASGNMAHADGDHTHAAGNASQAHGVDTVAQGYASTSEGRGTIAQGDQQHVSGKYNIPDTASNGGQYAEIVGNGSGDGIRSNAYALGWNGDAHFAGDVYVNCDDDSTGGSRLAKVNELPDIREKLDRPVVAGTNGQVLTSDGQGGQTWQTPATVFPIDDTAGSGDTDKVWSANKTATELSSLTDTIDDVVLVQNTQPDSANNKIWINVDESDTGIQIPTYAEFSELQNTVNGKYTKPAAGIPASDLANGVIPDVSGFYTKPSGGIPASDLANGVIPDVSGKQNAPTTAGTSGQVLGLDNGLNPVWMTPAGGAEIDDTAGTGDTTKVWSADKATSEVQTLSSALNDKYEKPSGGIPASDLASGVIPAVPVQDVQVNGTSILNNGVANVPIANQNRLGLICCGINAGGVGLSSETHAPYIVQATQASLKEGTNPFNPITPQLQHSAAFYGLAKAAGDTTQASSSNAVGSYTETAQSKIHEMLDAPVTVSGSTPSITAKAGIRYLCGTVTEISITPPQSGIIDVVFTAGSNCVLTLPNTVKLPGWFDATSLDSGTTYEINVADGVYGAVMAWT